MSNASPVSSVKPRDSSSKTPLLNSRRLSELLGFLLGVAGLLLLLSLASFIPQDPSLNTSEAAGGVIHNWVGPSGSYMADALFQWLGWVAYLLPATLFVVGGRLLLGRPFDAPRTKAHSCGTAFE